MTTRRMILALIAAIAFCATGQSKPAAADENRRQPKLDLKQLKKLKVAEIKKNIESHHPAHFYILAGKLFSANKRDEAVFWFYVGQLRYRIHLDANPKIDPTGDPALFTALSAMTGQPINHYAFGDIPRLAKTIDDVLKWDAEHENKYTSRDEHPQAHKKNRDGIRKLQKYIVENEDEIKVRRNAPVKPAVEKDGQFDLSRLKEYLKKNGI